MSLPLLRLRDLVFEGAGSYRQSTGLLPLGNQGRVLLCGPEGSGKSMVPEVATLVLYGKGSPRMRSTGLAESTIVNKDTGYLAKLAFESGYGAAARHVAIEQAFKHKRAGSRYVINIDNQRPDDSTPLNKLEQKKLVKRLAPLSYNEWLGVVYLAQNGIHDLLLGTPTQKRDYLTSVFGLDFYDDLLTEAEEELKRLRKEAEGALELQQRLADAREELKKAEERRVGLPTPDEVDNGMAKLARKLHVLAQDIGRLQGERDAEVKRQQLEQELAAWGPSIWASKEDAEAELNSIKVRQQKLQSERGGLIAEIKNLTAAVSAYETAKERIAVLETEIKATKQALASTTAKIKTLPSIDDLTHIGGLLSEASKLGLTSLEATAKENLLDWRGAISWLRDTQVMLNKVKALKTTDTRCPTCTQPLGADKKKHINTELHQALQGAQNTAVTGLLEELAPYLKDKPLLSGVTDMEVAISRVAQACRVFDMAEDLGSDLNTKEVNLQNAKKALAEKPKDPDKLKARVNEITKESKELDDAGRKATKVMAILAGLAALPKTKTEGLEENLARLQAEHVLVKGRHNDAVKLMQQVNEAEAAVKLYKKQRNDLKAKVEEHATTALTIKTYEDELIPYFTALRASKVRSRIGILESVLPVYVNVLATDQYKDAALKFEISDDLEDVDLMLKPSRFGPWLSALQNSGGQRQRFMIALYAGLYEVSPRRANAIFLDEPFVGMQGDGKLLVINRLLPLLQERCPGLESIFVISHDDEVLNAANDSFDSVWTVDRDERGSSIHIGQRLAAVAGK